MQNQNIPINVGDTLFIEHGDGQCIESRVLDKAIQSNSTYFYLDCPDKNKWINENELGKTIFTPEQYRQKPSVSKEREDELQELFWAETNEEWTQEWRDNLTKDEQKLVDKWDAAYNRGVKSICEKILELEKSRSAPQMF
ncbi:hypothetical protein [Acetanaerobacterium elongatum]|uniref:Uncharacterized protein n=1 Tax=Acetanaerobacterium elongatum TaxID=258515 RepID=A0A1H0F0U6_9FIRM|nr:hypothetical protein [Acetanaerobacterium elongatum]SDN88193.1 hypothetical protein SAMN05192585_13716 [Acetanaerobacterium elongatum]